MNDNLLDELLHEDESSTLDFKRDQYPFIGATDEQKGELLKDILAFANAWRRTTAYILIGVEEVKGGRSLLHGVTQHLNDNDLQQLVNAKTNRPVTFAYQAYPFEGVQLGIIEIPQQVRPVFLKKAFGKLAATTVYVRRGSSTDPALPDEVARMGASDAGRSDELPAFEFGWADISGQTALGLSVQLHSLVLSPQLSTRSIMPRSGPIGITLGMGRFDEPGESYYRSLIDYSCDSALLSPIGFCLRNVSGVAASSVVVKIRINKVAGVRLHDWHGRPVKPSRVLGLGSLSSIRTMAEQMRQDPDPVVQEFPTHWQVTVPFGKVLPKSTIWSSDVLYIGSEHRAALTFDAELFAENLPSPQLVTLTANVEAAVRAMERSDLLTDEDA